MKTLSKFLQFARQFFELSLVLVAMRKNCRVRVKGKDLSNLSLFVFLNWTMHFDNLRIYYLNGMDGEDSLPLFNGTKSKVDVNRRITNNENTCAFFRIYKSRGMNNFVPNYADNNYCLTFSAKLFVKFTYRFRRVSK